jgi:hypothetical protein
MTFCGVAELVPIIEIDPTVERNIILQNLYYRSEGYYRNVKNFHETCKKAGYNFHPKIIRDWLHRQSSWQIHAPRPKYIPRASFNKIIVPNEVLQADILYMPWDKVDKITYLFCLTVVDVASRFKWAVPIGTTLDILNMDDDFSLEGILTSVVVAECFEKMFNDPQCPLTWPKLLITDKGSEFRGNCEKLMNDNSVKIQKANSKHTMGIVERFNRTLSEKLFKIQYAEELLLPFPKRSRVWVKNLPKIISDLNNSVTRLLGLAPADAIKKKYVYAKPSKSRNGPMGFNEVRLTHIDLVRYLLLPGELEGGQKRATDCIWSPQIYHIKKSIVQKNQPVLYWLENGPKRSFVREELMAIPHDTELPPQNILNH